jgi:SNF family Na+-dependent transporter
MKKKLIIGFAATMFAAITMVNINLAMKAYNGDASLESIAVMAQAGNEETPDSKWYRVGVYTWVTENITITYYVEVTTWVVIQGVLTEVKAGTTRTETKTVSKWDCIGYSGNC